MHRHESLEDVDHDVARALKDVLPYEGADWREMLELEVAFHVPESLAIEDAPGGAVSLHAVVIALELS